MTMTMIPTVAAARPRTLSMQGAPLAVGTWRSEVPAITVPTFRRTKSAFPSTAAYYNSIHSTVAAATVSAVSDVVRDHVGADKQAAPPRGVPR